MGERGRRERERGRGLERERGGEGGERGRDDWTSKHHGSVEAGVTVANVLFSLPDASQS